MIATSRKIKLYVGTFLHYLVLLAIAAVVLVPFLWMLSTSLKGRGVLHEIPPRWIPETFYWHNYSDVLFKHHFLRYSINTVYVSLMVGFGQLLTCSLAGFAFARLKFVGRNLFFALLLATMMIPLQVMIIPEFLIMLKLNWIDHPVFPALIVPSWLAGAFGTFMLRQFFMTVPKDLEDAGRIDGCNIFGIYWRIFLPLSVPALATLFIFAVMTSWNDLLRPILYISSQHRMTLTIGLANFTRQYDVNENMKMAGSLFTLLPLVILYAFAQKYFVQGITLSGLKG
jgi:ABC-type glycerol-3-phosphate transport system permease component